MKEDLASIHDEADPPEAASSVPVHNERLEDACNRLVSHVPRENDAEHNDAMERINLDLDYIRVNRHLIIIQIHFFLYFPNEILLRYKWIWNRGELAWFQITTEGFNDL